ncbi:MAG: hypothetical protein ACK4XY_09825 [Chloroherpetonaceae bacterium]
MKLISLFMLISALVGLGLNAETLHAQYRKSLLPISASRHTAMSYDHISKERLYETDKWFASDKVKHFSASFLLVVLGKIGSKELLKFDRAASSTSAVGSALLIGFAKEVIDDLNPNNIFSLKDLAADLLGIVLAILLLSLTPY